MSIPQSVSAYGVAVGAAPTTVPIVSPVAPTSTNIIGPNGQFPIGQRWIDQGTNSTYTLASISASNGALSATWVVDGGGSSALDQLTADTGTATPSGGSIKIAGGTGMSTSASGSTVTVTLTTPVTVPHGGTGVATMTTAFAPVCAGVTATGALQVADTGLGTSGYILTSNGASALPSFQANAGSFSLGAFGSTPNADGLTLSTGVLNMQPADGTHPGGVSTTTQTLAGAKTFSTSVSTPTYLLTGTTGVISILPQSAAGTYNFNMPTTAGTSGYFLTSDGGGAGGGMTWTDPTGIISLGAFGSTPNADGLSLSSNTLTMQPADGTNPGGVSTTTQTIAGAKTFTTSIATGVAGASIGGVLVSGNTSGTISILPQAAAGTYNFNLPITAGTSGYFLTSAGGAGSPMTWTNPTGVSVTLTGDSGSATGNTITVEAEPGSGTLGCGASVSFSGTGSTLHFHLTDAQSNTYLGVGAGNVLLGNQNVALGQNALSTAGTATDANTAIGYQALYLLEDGGAYNVGVGFNAGSSYGTTESHNISINANGTASESNVLRIGAGTGTGQQELAKAFISGIYGVTTTSSTTATVLVSDGDQLGTVSSSLRYKENVKTLEDSSWLQKLRPVSFKYKAHTDGGIDYGLIAEEVAEIAPQVVNFDAEGRPDSVRYHQFYGILIAEIQRLQRQIDDLKSKV